MNQNCLILYPAVKKCTCPIFKKIVHYNLYVAQILEIVFDSVENIMGKGENASYQHFLFLSTMFSKSLPYYGVKSHDCVLKVALQILE